MGVILKMKIKLIDDSGKEIEFKKTNIKRSDGTLTVIQIVEPLLKEVIPYEVQQNIEYRRQEIEKMFKEHEVDVIVIYEPDKNYFAKFNTLKKNKSNNV